MSLNQYENYSKLKRKTSPHDFLLTYEDFEELTSNPVCVVSKVPLERGKPYKMPQDRLAFSLDRVDSNLPYVKENVVVMSRFFNLLKNNSTREDLRYLIEVLSSYEKDILNPDGTWSMTIKDFKFIPTMSVSKADNLNLLNLVKKADLVNYDFDNAISHFIGIKSNCVLLSVFRFVEGSDDDRLEFGVKMFYSTCLSDPLNESQKMGRFSRWFGNNPNGIKQCGYYASLEISGDLDQIKKSLINRFKSWISFVRSFSSNSNNLVDNKIKTKEQIQKEIKVILDLYVDIDTINTFQIDIQSDIINYYTNSNSDITKISNALKLYNSKSEPNKLIDTKSKYDVWAIQYGYPSCDELIESGFNDFTKLFNLDSQKYLSWTELKKLCKEYQNKYSNLRPIEIYNIMKKENFKISDEPEEI
jgi:hypothetical protein